LLSVSAREEQTGQEQSIKIEGASILARDEVTKMIKEAEENSAFDKAKKSLVNITYEFDNLLSKAEILLDELTNSSLNETIEYLSYSEFLKKIKEFYSSNSLNEIFAILLDELDYFITILTFESIKNKLLQETNDSSNSKGKGKGTVIDVTDD